MSAKPWNPKAPIASYHIHHCEVEWDVVAMQCTRGDCTIYKYTHPNIRLYPENPMALEEVGIGEATWCNGRCRVFARKGWEPDLFARIDANYQRLARG